MVRLAVLQQVQSLWVKGRGWTGPMACHGGCMAFVGPGQQVSRLHPSPCRWARSVRHLRFHSLGRCVSSHLTSLFFLRGGLGDGGATRWGLA